MSTETSPASEYAGQDRVESPFKGRRLCLLAPFPPRKGGVTVQTDLLARSLEADGVRLIKVDTNLQKLRFGRFSTPIRLILQPWVVAFRLLVALPKCEVVHIQAAANWGYMPAVLGAPLARLFRKRSVMTFHSGVGPIFMDRLPWLVKFPFRMVTVPGVCSRELQDAFRERGVEVELHYNLFETELYKYKKRVEFRPKIVWTRSFEELYDPMAAVEAFEIVKRRWPDATIVMAGNGPMLPIIKAYAKEHGISGMTFPGRVPSAEVARLMSEADICLNTSKHDGLPTALLEAAASGLPIITTVAGGIASLFQSGVSAMLCEVGDFQGMADAILYLLDNPDHASDMGAKAADIAAQYTWPRASKVLAKAYGFLN